jgi:MoaA/NifB/PqqE/SkfB family radical SAM enzyme
MLPAVPIYVSWNYTYACNFNCTHCYSRAGWYPQELDTPAYERIVQQFIDNQIMRVGLGGGEPMSRKDVLHVLGLMGEDGIDTNMTTNAWFLDDAAIQGLATARLGTLYVSVDSADPSAHDAFRRKDGSFSRVERGVARAVAAGLRVVFSTVLTQKNVHMMDEFVRLALAWQVAGIEFKRFRPTGNGAEVADELTLPKGEQAAVPSVVGAARRAHPQLDIRLIYNAETEGGASDVDSGCPCGVRSLTLRPNGDVATCAYSATTLGNLASEDIGTIWREHPALAAVRSGGGCAAIRRQLSPSQSGAPRGRRLAGV